MTWDSPEFRAQRDHQLFLWFNKDADAVQCFLAISNIAEVWDDIVDGDPIQPADADLAFTEMMIGLNDNPFFLKNRDRVMSVMIITLNAWHDANAMAQSENKDDRIKAYTLRNLGLELVPLFIYITCGYHIMRRESLSVREFFAHENFGEWERENAH